MLKVLFRNLVAMGSNSPTGNDVDEKGYDFMSKIGIRTMIAASGFIFGAGAIVFAYAVPGIDKPFDPANYYSDTTVSYADSAPSTFALREIGKGSVYDPLRKIKSALFGADFKSIEAILLNRNTNDAINVTPFDASILNLTKNEINTINASTVNMDHNSAAVANTRSSTLFRDPNRYDDASNSYKETEQLAWMQNVYRNAAQTAADNLNDQSDQFDALNQVMQNSNAALGSLQAEQAKAQLEAIKEAAIARRNAMLANYMSVDLVREMKEEDDSLKAARAAQSGRMTIADPYHPSAYDNSVYVRPEAAGFKYFGVVARRFCPCLAQDICQNLLPCFAA